MLDIVYNLPVDQLAAWDAESFLKNTETTLKTLGGLIMAVLGVAALIVAAFKLFQKFTSEEKARQISWFTIIGLFIIAGLLIFGGMQVFTAIAQGGNTTLVDLGK